ncbi:hypothetical protein [Dysgonomonas termitidis]|uniref:Uncharacterized protein n=1 Tax=Dysgonomonas termitidis TaxID=1516126 RepID=A0ABV9KTP5_9BACT
MSIFGYAILIFIIIRFVNHFIKQSRDQKQTSSSGFNWSDSYSLRLRSVLKTCEEFNDDEIIDSAVGFYLFSYDNTAREFIFIEDDDVIHRLSYSNLIEYKVRENKDYKIMIDLKASFSGKPYISLACFDREKLLRKMPQLQYKLYEIDNLYELERNKIDEIEDILSGIIEENKMLTGTPPPYKKEVIVKEPNVIKIEIPPVTANVADIVTAIKEEKEDAVTFLEERPVIEPAEENSGVSEIVAETKVEQPGPVPEKEEATDIEPEVEEEVPVIDGNIQISLAEIEEYSRGKFLEYEVRSAVSDAKMKGQKYICLSKEQLEKLKS